MGKPNFLKGLITAAILLTTVAVIRIGPVTHIKALTQQQSGAVGVEGTVPSDPPTLAATITVPSNGQVFSSIPIKVAGLCPKGLLVEIFKNGVFAGSTECPTGSYSLQIDLFDGRNDLIARVYDSLNQAGPDSNTVTVTFNNPLGFGGSRVLLTTAFAKRGATPGTTLTWPLSLSGGKGPYAISIDWGDKSPLDLISRPLPGDFTIEHIYGQSGVYNITLKASDSGGSEAFLQVVGIGNGPIQQVAGAKQNTQVQRVVLWWPFLLTIALVIIAFWAGQKHQLEIIRDRLRRGERPFK